MSAVRLFGRPLTKCRPFALWSVHKEGPMRTLAHGLPSRPLGAHLAAADALSGGCCWSSSTRAFMVEVYTSVSAGRTVPVARRVRNCVLFNVIVPYTRGTSRTHVTPRSAVRARTVRGPRQTRAPMTNVDVPRRSDGTVLRFMFEIEILRTALLRTACAWVASRRASSIYLYTYSNDIHRSYTII